MKNLLLVLQFLFVVVFAAAQGAGVLTLSPGFPVKGETIDITYQPGDSPLKESAIIQAVAYLDGKKAIAIELTKKEGIYYGSLVPEDDTKIISFLFLDEEYDERDNNDGKGYLSMIYTMDRKKPVQGASLMHGYALGTYPGYSIDRDPEKGLEYMKKEFELYPESKSNIKYLENYNYIANKVGDEDAKLELLAIANEMSKAKNSEEKMYFSYKVYDTQKKNDLKKAVEKTLRKKFPKGDFVKSKLRSSFYDTEEIAEKENKYQEYLKIMDPSDEDDIDMKKSMAGAIFSACAEKEDFTKADKYLAIADEYIWIKYELMSVAEALAGEKITDEPKKLAKAEYYGKKALDIAENSVINPGEKPDYVTPEQYNKRLKNDVAYLSGTYAMICHKQGRAEEAMKYHLDAKYAYGDPGMDWYEKHSVYYDKINDDIATENLLAQYIKEGYASNSMKSRYKELFLANNTINEVFDKYMVLLEEEANKKLLKEMEKKILDEEAPDFDLVNLHGERVKLSDLRGKTVVLDFWATWCGPCKASFPAMQKMVDLNKDNEDIVFLFVDSWEKEDSKEEEDKIVRTFIEKEGYTFNTLMDYDDKVINSYKVNGIPTKFVIGPTGRINFKSVGFEGSDDGMIKELKMMIELASRIKNDTAAAGN